MHAECNPNDLEHCCGDCLYEIAKAQRAEAKELRAKVEKAEAKARVLEGVIGRLRENHAAI